MMSIYSRVISNMYVKGPSFGRVFGINSSFRSLSTEVENETIETDSEEFRVLALKKGNIEISRRGRRSVGKPKEGKARCLSMPTDVDWGSVWGGTRTFHPAVVPLPLRQGVNPLGAAPNKYANAELLKIPNFLHLTPPAVKRQCSALKKFCSEWPNSDALDEHFPLRSITSDYCHSSPSVRNPLSRIVVLKVPVGRLGLEKRALDKFLRLVGDRYCHLTHTLTLVADKCPTKKQNLDYTLYLLTALVYESKVIEKWESEKTEEDKEYFDWEKSKSKKNIEKLTSNPEQIDAYSKAVLTLFDEGEDDSSLAEYKQVSVRLLFPSQP